MIKAKLLALCVCPVLATPPAILAVNRPARHAVAHLLHHAANRLDGHLPTPVAPPALAAAECAPLVTASSGGGGLAAPGGIGGSGGGFAPGIGLGANGAAPDAASPIGGGGFSGGGGFGGGGGGGSGGGGSGGGGSGVPIAGGGTLPGSTPTFPGTPLPSPPAGSTTAMGSVPDPAIWAMMVAGFGVVGVSLRYRRPLLRT